MFVVSGLLGDLMFVGLIYRQYRKFALQKLAKKFNLNYQYGDHMKITLWKNVEYKRNIITGKINNHNIELYDILRLCNLGVSRFSLDTILLIEWGDGN